MTLRLGFVGVGRWARKLAAAFRACGAEIICHDRQTKPEGVHPADRPSLDGFGFWMPWASQLQSPAVDAMIVVAPPEATTAVALACAEAGKPVMATKPLFDHPKNIRAPFYVDFWRLWSKAYDSIRRLPPHVRGESVWLSGPGPERGFPGGLDYGPHVMAAIFDAFPAARLVNCSNVTSDGLTGESFHCEFYDKRRDYTVVCEFGNGSEVPVRTMWSESETPTHIGSEEKSAVLQRFCQSFLNDVSEGFVDTRLLELSRRGMEELRKIREMAK